MTFRNNSSDSMNTPEKSDRLRWPWRLVAPLIALAVVAGVGFYQQQDDDLFELRKNFEIFGALYEQIILGYVDDVRPQPFMRAGVEAMLNELDPYTQYYDEADMTRMRLLQENSEGGVGMTIGQRGGRIVVLAPDDRTSAYEQGVRAGDILVEVGGTSAAELTVEEVTLLLVGEPGTTVQVVVQRPGEETTRIFTLVRERDDRANVSHAGFIGEDTTRGLAYVKLDQFGSRAARETRRALRNMNRERELNGIILDLRNNPGGILGEAIAVVDLFVPENSTVVSTRARAEGLSQVYRTDREPLFPDTPVVVLMNGISASASEIVAGALQDYDRAVILGETSFGKGLVQVVRELPHNTSLKMTISRYYTPSGRSIQSAELVSDAARATSPSVERFNTTAGRPVMSGRGIEPDVPAPPTSAGPLTAALRQRGIFFLYADELITGACAVPGNDCLSSDEGLVAGLRDFAERRDFSWQLPEEQTLEELISELPTGSGVSDALASIRTDIETRKARAYLNEEVALAAAIRSEVRGRVLDGADRYRAEMRDDAWVASAVSLLEAPDRMQSILSAR